MKTPISRFALLFIVVATGLLLCLASPAQAQLPSQLYEEAVQANESGNTAEAKRKLALALQVDKNFRPASDLLRRIGQNEAQTKANPANGAVPVSMKTLGQITFPVEFKNTSLETALEFIRQQIEAKSAGKAQANFVIQLPAELANKKINLTLNHVPVSEMLRYIGDLTGVSFKVQQFAIAVVPAAQAAPAPAETSPAPTP